MSKIEKLVDQIMQATFAQGSEWENHARKSVTNLLKPIADHIAKTEGKPSGEVCPNCLMDLSAKRPCCPNVNDQPVEWTNADDAYHAWFKESGLVEETYGMIFAFRAGWDANLPSFESVRGILSSAEPDAVEAATWKYEELRKDSAVTYAMSEAIRVYERMTTPKRESVWQTIETAPKGDGVDCGPIIFAGAAGIRPGYIRWNPFIEAWESAFSDGERGGIPYFPVCVMPPTHWITLPQIEDQEGV